jgi:hypothetical protein
MRTGVQDFVDWYNDERPHRALAGATPNQIYEGRTLARDGPRFETRERYPTNGVELRAPRGTVVELDLDCYRRNQHLPVIRLKRAA